MCPMSNIIVSCANIFNIVCPVCVDVSFGDVSYVLFPQTLDILFCCGKKLHDCYFTLKNVSKNVSNGCNFASQDFNSGRLNQNKIDLNRFSAVFF